MHKQVEEDKKNSRKTFLNKYLNLKKPLNTARKKNGQSENLNF